MNITEIIKSNLSKMTKSEYAVAVYFLENSGSFAFETLEKTAEKINTSTTSVLRFCRKNGFDGYKDFQEEVRNSLRYQFTLPDKLKLSSNSSSDGAELSRWAKNAVECIDKSFKDIPLQRIAIAADHIISAKRVFCFGRKESFALAHYAYTRFLTIRDNVSILSAGLGGEIESLLSLGEGDVCIFYLFHRYTRQSPQILKQIKKQGAFVILITNPPSDEVNEYANILFPCQVDIGGIKNSCAAPVCITDCICNAAVSKSGSETMEYMKKSEELFESFTF